MAVQHDKWFDFVDWYATLSQYMEVKENKYWQ